MQLFLIGPGKPKPESEHKPFKAYEPGYVHVDVKYLPQMQYEDKRRYVGGFKSEVQHPVFSE